VDSARKDYMARRRSIEVIVVSLPRLLTPLFALIVSVGVPAGEPDGSNWERWGPEDQLGTLNFITPDVVRRAASLVRQGKVISLALPLEDGTPTWPGRVYRRYSPHSYGHAPGHEGMGGGDDVLMMSAQYGTQWDGLSHIFYDDQLYGGHAASEHISVKDGALRNDIDAMRDRFVTRGVLLDLPRQKGLDHLPPGYAITPEDLDTTLEAQEIDVRRGDCLMLRTGWLGELRKLPWPGTDPRTMAHPGVGMAVARWMKDKEIACFAVDTLAFEVMPHEAEALEQITDKDETPWLPLHVEFLRNQGMPVGEIFALDELAEDCAADGVYEFMFVAPPLRLVGGFGSPVNPQAIK